MRMLMQVKIPNPEFNAAVRDGSIGSKMGRILEAAKPEAVYYVEYGGQRGAIMIVDVAEPSRIPGLAEPWFLLFNASIEFHVVMGAEDLGRADLDSLGKKWG